MVGSFPSYFPILSRQRKESNPTEKRRGPWVQERLGPYVHQIPVPGCRRPRPIHFLAEHVVAQREHRTLDRSLHPGRAVHGPALLPGLAGQGSHPGRAVRDPAVLSKDKRDTLYLLIQYNSEVSGEPKFSLPSLPVFSEAKWVLLQFK